MLWNAKNRQIPIGDTKMQVASFGKGEKVLIILPGLSDGLTTVEGKALLLAKPYKLFFEKYTVYMFSRKDQMPEGYSIEDMADDQAKALKELGINKASVLGVSQGGMIAMRLAVRHPEMVEKLVVAVSAAQVSDMIRSNIEQWIRFAEKKDHKQLMIDTAEKSYSQEYLNQYRKMYPLLGMIGKPKTYDRFLVNANAILKFDVLDKLANVQAPTLIIGGDDDKIVGVDASYEIHQRIPGSRLHIYQGLGHAAYEEAKDFNKI